MVKKDNYFEIFYSFLLFPIIVFEKVQTCLEINCRILHYTAHIKLYCFFSFTIICIFIWIIVCWCVCFLAGFCKWVNRRGGLLITGFSSQKRFSQSNGPWRHFIDIHLFGLPQKLPLWLEREKFVDELFWISEEVMVVVLIPIMAIWISMLNLEMNEWKYLPQAVRFSFSRFGHLFGIDEMSGAPIALHKTPGSGNINSIPGIPETIVLEFHTRLVAGWFTVALNDYTVKSSKTENK